MGGDDEVIMQTPYDDEDGIFSAGKSGSSYGVPALQDRASAHLRPQSNMIPANTIIEPCSIQGHVMTTLHLDGE